MKEAGAKFRFVVLLCGITIFRLRWARTSLHLQYHRESSEYIYGPGDIGGGKPVVFPDQEDIGEDDGYEEGTRGMTCLKAANAMLCFANFHFLQLGLAPFLNSPVWDSSSINKLPVRR